MEDVTNEELLNEEGCRHEKDTEEILVVPPIQSPPRSDFVGPDLLNLRKQLQCHLCDYVADRQSNFIRHLRTHGRNQKFKCKICNFSSNSKCSLTNHTNNQHQLQLFADDKNEEFGDNNDLELKFNDEDSESDSCSLTHGLGPNEKVPSASKLISISLKKKKNFLIRKQQHRHPFFFSSKRERKRQFHPFGLHRLPHLTTKVVNDLRKKSFKSLRLKKSNIPFQSLTRIVKRPMTSLDRSLSLLPEKNPRSKIHVDCARQKGASKFHLRFRHRLREEMEEVGKDEESIKNAHVLPNSFNERRTQVETTPPGNPSPSQLPEKNPPNISCRFEPPSETADGKKRESRETKKMFYECPVCDCTFNQSKQTADKIKHHVKAHDGNGRNKCIKCSFSHDRLNILTFHLKYHHRGRIEPNKEESVQVKPNDPVLPKSDERENYGGTNSSILEGEETIYFDALEIGSPDSPPDLGELVLGNYLGSPGSPPDLESPGSPPDLGAPFLGYDLTEKTLDYEIECPDSPPDLEVLANPKTPDFEEVKVVVIPTTPNGFDNQSSERNPIAGDEILDLRFVSETPERRVLSEEHPEVEQQPTSAIPSNNGSFQDTSFLLESDAFDSLMEMGDDLVDQVLSSDNDPLEPKFPEAMPESSQKIQLPNSNSSEPRISAANDWIKNFNLFFEAVMEVKRKDVNGSHSTALRVQLNGAETECKMLFKEFNAELKRAAAIRLQEESKQQQPILQENKDHPVIRKAHSKVNIAKEAFRSAEIRLAHIREEEKVLQRKMEAIHDVRTRLQDALLGELKIQQEFLESLVFNSGDIQAEFMRRQMTIESIKKDLTEVEKNIQSFLTKERIVSECYQRAREDLVVAHEQQCVNQLKLNDLVCDKKSKPLFYKEEVNRFPFLTEKMELCKKLNSCLLKIAEELHS